MTNQPERLRLPEHGMYRPKYGSEASGIGLVAATDGTPSRGIPTTRNVAE